MGQLFLIITDGVFRLKDTVSCTSGYHLCLNSNLTQPYYSILLEKIPSPRKRQSNL